MQGRFSLAQEFARQDSQPEFAELEKEKRSGKGAAQRARERPGRPNQEPRLDAAIAANSKWIALLLFFAETLPETAAIANGGNSHP